jgi:hypothetical protein
LDAFQTRVKHEQPLIVLIIAVELFDRLFFALAGHADDEATSLQRAARGLQRAELAARG